MYFEKDCRLCSEINYVFVQSNLPEFDIKTPPHHERGNLNFDIHIKIIHSS